MARYVCPRCGAPGAVDEGYTMIDPRYAKGFCTGEHRELKNKVDLVREDFNPTVKKPKKRRAT
jgi:hypothetical protein